jgi:choline dehydrogenase-like flavoprotein
MMGQASVLVVGAGPTGLMLAAELALVGISVRVLERRSEESNLTRLLLAIPSVHRSLRRRVSGLAVAYPPPRGTPAHPWAGRRTPDVGLDGSRLYERLRHGRFTLADCSDGQGERLVAVGWADRVATVRVPPTSTPGWPALTLIRPDGYVAWASDDTAIAAARAALTRWCGPTAAIGTPTR